MIEKAREFASKAHDQQKYGELPYMTHVEAVAEMVKPYGEEAIVAAYLHDVLEDTKTDEKEIESEFGSSIVTYLKLITDESGGSRRDRKRKTYARLGGVTGKEELALIVSAADRLANMRACIAARDVKRLKMYVDEWDAFEPAVYRKGLCDELWSALTQAKEEGEEILEQPRR